MALVSSSGPAYELSLLNLETGNIEILMTVDDNKTKSTSMNPASFYRESYTRDSFSWPEKSENNSSLFKRYLM